MRHPLMMKKQTNQRDPFGDITIEKPEAAIKNNTPGRTVRHLRQPPFSRQAIPPKAKLPAPVSIILTLLGVLGISYLACGYFLLPVLIKTVASPAFARHLGRPVTIGQVEFDPLRIRLTLINGIIGPLLSTPTDTVDPILSFSRLSIDLEAVSLTRRAIICRELNIEQPFLHLVHSAKNQFNITTLVPPSTPDRNTPFAWLISKAASRYSINNIEITKGEVRFDDIPTSMTHRLEKIRIALPTIENINYHSGDLLPQFSAWVNGTPIMMTGQTTLSQQGPTTAQMSLKMQNLDLAAYKDYLPPSLGIQSLGGQGDLDLQLFYDGAHSEKLRLIGEITLRSFQCVSPQGQLDIDSGRIKGWIAPISKKFHADTVTLAHPVWHRPATKKFPWHSLAAAIVQPDPMQSGSMPITLLQITNGEIIGTQDAPTSPASDWRSIDASINTAQTPDGPEQAFFSLNSRADSGARLNLQGSASSAPFTAKGLLNVNMFDIATIKGLWEPIGLPLPVTGGIIDQAQANFEVALGPDQQPTLNLDPLAIQAKNIQVEINGQTLDIPVWQSEQGSFNLSEPSLDLGNITLQQAKLTCRRRSDTSNWQTLLTGPDGKTAPFPAINFKGLELVNGSLLVENQGPPDIKLRLERFDLQMDQIDHSQPNPLSVAAMVDDKYPVQATGTFTLAPFKAALNLQATEVPLSVFQPLIDHYFVLPANGLLSADGILSLPTLDFTGTWSITKFAAPPISCRKIDGEQTIITLRPLRLAIDRLNLEGPSLQISANENGMPLLPPLVRPGWLPKETPDQTAVAIKAITMADGSLIYDFPGPPGLTISHSQIKGELSNFIVAKDQIVNFTFSGNMENTAEFNTKGTIQPFATPPAMTMNSQVKDLPLSSLATIIEPYWGFSIKEGTLDFDNDMTFENTLIHDKPHLTMKGLRLGSPLAPQAIKAIGATWETLPLIQALLQSADGTINLTVPVDGRTDTGFTYFEAMKTFLNQLLLKATVSPLSVLGNAQKTIPETVAFEPGSDRIITPMEEVLSALATFLSEHPMVAITLYGSSDTADQKALLRLNKKTSKAQLPKDSLKKLATQRTQAVSDFLTSHGASLQQIIRLPPETAAPENSTRGRHQVSINVTVAK